MDFGNDFDIWVIDFATFECGFGKQQQQQQQQFFRESGWAGGSGRGLWESVISRFWQVVGGARLAILPTAAADAAAAVGAQRGRKVKNDDLRETGLENRSRREHCAFFS